MYIVVNINDYFFTLAFLPTTVDNTCMDKRPAIRSIISVRIKEAREKLGITQVELADLIHASRASIVNWETAKRTPSVEDMYNLASALNVSFVFLLGEKVASLREADKDAPLPGGCFDTSVFSTTYEYVKRHAKDGSLKEIQIAKDFLHESIALLEDSIDEQLPPPEASDEKGAVA